MQQRRFRLSKQQKRAVIGIGTLIVFIAMILVAAIAAGVIIRTSGVLQERSYAVAGQARKRLVTGMEVTEVYGNSNRTVPSVPQLEISIRLRPGASEVNLRQMGMTITTEELARAATLQHSSVDKYQSNFTGIPITNASWYALLDDLNQDGSTDYMKIGTGTGNAYDYLMFNISGIGIANISLKKYIRNASDYSTGVDVSLTEEKIEHNKDIYGYVTLNVNVTKNSTINASASEKFYIKQFPSKDICSFETLIPERYFCYRVKLGDTDPILEPGESMTLYYMFKEENALVEDEEFQIAFVPKDGAITYLYGQIPSVVRKTKVLIWPS